ncbi:dimethyladenosine transferase 2, mitochondrial [Leptodactylus fuscus]|uniref:dimethyladenosine transferase 2, mitochondrial n=1 Tax=Leptodactylus fuscus TaxID=238119 RepID=UPI003F4F2743
MNAAFLVKSFQADTMFSVWAARCGLTVLRCGPQAVTPALFCSRHAHNASILRSDDTVHQYPSPKVSVKTPQKRRKAQRSIEATDECSVKNIAESCKYFRRFITDPGLVNSVLKCLAPVDPSRTEQVIMECNPGLGILTQALLDAGHKVVALESDSNFIPSLERKRTTSEKQLKVVHCDFFRIDPWSEGLVQPPSMYSSDLMKTLNFNEVSWSSDIPLKVVLMLNHKRERILLWRQIYLLYERLSVFRFGRVELNVFMTEKQYLKLISRPGDFKQYHALTVLYQAACDIELLHKVPMSSFWIPSKFSAVAKSGASEDENFCLVRLTPRRNLFSENFTPMDGKTFIHVIKQFLATRKSKLIEKLDNLAPGNGKRLLQNLALPVDIATGCVYAEEYKLLFEIMARSEEFHYSFVANDICEDVAATSY